MTGDRVHRPLVVAIIAATLFGGPAIRAQQPDGSKPPASSDAPADKEAPANDELEKEYARLAGLLSTGNALEKLDAAEKLLLVRPNDVASKDTRILIARGYRSLALENGSSKAEAIRGLVIWGGKYSVPVLIEVMDKQRFKVSDEVFAAFGYVKDPRGAEAVARYLGDFFNREEAIKSLRAMGSVAEVALIKAAPSSDANVSLAAVQLLGEVGGEKSIAILQRASEAKTLNVKTVAREALKKVRLRKRNGESVDTPADDPNSPFAPGKGPPVDIRVLADRKLGRAGEIASTTKSPTIVISKATTFITEPFRADGFPDYEQYALTLSRKGVKPADNAAVPICQAMWPGEVDPADYDVVGKELGFGSVPSADAALKRLDSKANEERLLTWLRANGQPNATEESSRTLADQAQCRAWKSSAVPPLADWVKENAPTIDLIVAASRRPQYYWPSPSFLNTTTEPLIEAVLPGARMLRDASRGLGVRAMGRLGDGQIDQAWSDILAMHRLARLGNQAPFLVEKIIAFQINADACRATFALIASGQASVDQARQIEEDLMSLAELQGISGAIDKMERVFYLDSVLSLKAGKAEGWKEFLGLNDAFVQVASLPADWNIVLRRGNAFFDRIAIAARMPVGPEREKAFAALDAELEQAQVDSKNGLKSIKTLSIQERGELYSSLTLSLMCPAVSNVVAMQDSANTMLQLARTAAGLAAYRAQHGEYPEALEAMVPGALEKLPLDTYTSKPFVYKRQDSGYLLYSVGANGRDDGGSSEQSKTFQGHVLDETEAETSQNASSKIPAGADDIVVLAPPRVFAVPNAAR